MERPSMVETAQRRRDDAASADASWAAPVLLVVLAAVAAVIGYTVLARPDPARLRIATGTRGGSALPLGRALAKVLLRRFPDARAEAVPSPGGAENVRLVEEGVVELGLVPNDATGGPHVRTLARLYDEVLHIAVRRGVGIESLDDLRGRAVALGPRGSGTEHLAGELLRHFGIDERAMKATHMAHGDAATAFAAGRVDAVFSLVGLGASAMRRILSRPDARLLSLGAVGDPGSTLAGIKVGLPFVSAVSVPMRSYGREPRAAVGAVGVKLLLVARDDLPDHVAHAVTTMVFQNRVTLLQQEPSIVQLQEDFDRSDLRFPMHPGAESFYHRNDPYLIQAWAETISLFVTLVLLTWSGFTAIRVRQRQRRKDRVDVYYADIEAIARNVGQAETVEDLQALRQDLHRVRRQAFGDLIAERLDADESFTIFQDFLRTELLEIERQLSSHRVGGARSSSPPVE